MMMMIIIIIFPVNFEFFMKCMAVSKTHECVCCSHWVWYCSDTSVVKAYWC